MLILCYAGISLQKAGSTIGRAASDNEACDIKPSWNAAICEGDFGRLFLLASDGQPGSGPFGRTSGGSAITLIRNGRQFTTGEGGFFGDGVGNTTVPSGAEIKAKTESSSLNLNLSELDNGSWVIFELPGFATASTGTEQRSLDALRNASETSYYSDDDTLWVKLVVANSSGGGAGGFPGFGGGTGIQVSK